MNPSTLLSKRLTLIIAVSVAIVAILIGIILWRVFQGPGIAKKNGRFYFRAYLRWRGTLFAVPCERG